jgi:uncharacterized protein YndB with AHSA1/START domain
MLKLIGIFIVVVVAGVLLFAASRPDTFSVQRSTSIKAPPEKIFALVNDLKQWPAWSPWGKKDPNQKITYGLITAGQGASFAWEGNKEVGQGEMKVAASTPASLVRLDLHFIKPFEGRNQVDFKLEAQGDSTQVVWDMSGPAPFINKVMGLFMNFDKMIGKDFEEGLANLKALAEKP